VSPGEAHHARQRTLGDYLAILRRRKWLVIIPILIVPIMAYVYSVNQPKVFGASAEVLLSRQDLGLSLAGITNPDAFTDPDRFAETEAALARVPEVARRAIQLTDVEGVTPGALLAMSSVSVRGNADLLGFNVEHADSATAAKLAGAYARAYSRYRLQLETASLSNARKDLERSLQQLQDQGTTGTPLYRELTRRAQELRTMELLQAAPEVVRIPEEGFQVAPLPKRNAMLGIALGLLLGVGAALLWETFDRRVRDEDEIQRILGLSMLARLTAPQSANGQVKLAMLHSPSDAEAESIRRFLSNVDFANLDVNAKVIMVTSALSGEGKSLTIANLAVALARSGRDVALVDLDLRKPSAGKLFGIGYRAGFTDVAIDRVGLDQALTPINISARSPIQFTSRSARGRQLEVDDSLRPDAQSSGTLSLLPAGFLPANPGELVGTQAVAGILETLRGRFDFVLVDAPPLLAVSDAVTLSRRVDAVIVVLRRGMVDRPVVRELTRQLEAIPKPKLGFVLTGLEAGELYGQAYGYGATGREPRPEPVPEESALSELDGVVDVSAGRRSRRPG
jgi:Mrp family chromosome partitioning ATPase/capsular polysaccharide biosynthesis protein